MTFNHNTFRCGCGVVAALPHAKARSYGAKCEACARRSAESKPLAAAHASFELHEQRKLVPIDTGDLVEFGPPDEPRAAGGMVAAANNVYAKQREAQYASLHAAYGDAANLLNACDFVSALCSFAAKMATPVDYEWGDAWADVVPRGPSVPFVCTDVDQESGVLTFSSGLVSDAAVRARDDVAARRAGMGSCRDHDYLAKVLYPDLPKARVVSIGTPPSSGSFWADLQLPEPTFRREYVGTWYTEDDEGVE